MNGMIGLKLQTRRMRRRAEPTDVEAPRRRPSSRRTEGAAWSRRRPDSPSVDPFPSSKIHPIPCQSYPIIIMIIIMI